MLPGQLGIGVFSPRLDAHGNSVRGIRVCSALSRHWDLHLFNRPGIGRSTIRLRSSGTEYNSSRARTVAESQTLRMHGDHIQLYQLQGNLAFAPAEIVVREIIERPDKVIFLILDLKRVLTVSESASRLFAALLGEYSNSERRIVFTHLEGVPSFRRYLKAKLGDRFDELFEAFDDNDTALEACENRLLARQFSAESDDHRGSRADYEFFAGLDAGQIAVIEKLLQPRVCKAGETIINTGDEAHELYLLTKGRVSVVVTLPTGRRKRLATFSRGMAFREMAILDRAPRSAMLVADTEIADDALSLQDFEGLAESQPAIKIKKLENLALGLCGKLRKTNRELTMIE